VLVHGLGHRRQAWDPVLPRLARHREVIALDLPGFGESPPLPAGESYDVPTAMERFAELFAELGLGAPHVAGSSLGGALALELGARGMVSSVTALAPAGFWTPLERRWALTLLSTTRMSARVPDIVLRRGVAADQRVRTSMINLLYAHPERQDPDAFLGDARALKRQPDSRRCWRSAARTSAPPSRRCRPLSRGGPGTGCFRRCRPLGPAAGCRGQPTWRSAAAATCRWSTTPRW